MIPDPSKIKYIWLPGEVVNDRLTPREIKVYGIINFAGGILLVAYVAGAFWLNFFTAQLWHLTFILPIKVPVIIFGLALRTDTRVIHGIAWLRGK